MMMEMEVMMMEMEVMIKEVMIKEMEMEVLDQVLMEAQVIYITFSSYLTKNNSH
jgi:hypothetical protein